MCKEYGGGRVVLGLLQVGGNQVMLPGCFSAKDSDEMKINCQQPNATLCKPRLKRLHIVRHRLWEC